MMDDDAGPASDGGNRPIRIARCPICGKVTEQRFRPFCSKRCADLDLSRWFNGVYAVAATEEEVGDEG